MDSGGVPGRLAGPALSAASFVRAREQAGAAGSSLLAELEAGTGLPPAEFVRELGGSLDYPVLSAAELFACPPCFERVSLAEAMRRGFVMVEHAGERSGVFSDPFDAPRLAWIAEQLGGARLYLAHSADLAAYLARHEEEFRAVSALAADTTDADAAESVEQLSLASISEDPSLVVRLVNSTIYDALKAHASDIHLEMVGNGTVIKYRIDGVLTTAGRIAGRELGEQLVSRVKVLAELDIAEQRVPQDGRFKVAVLGREIDFRVSIMPSIHGEDAVLRVLDKQDLADQVQGVRLDALGFRAELLVQLRRLACEPHGMVLVTGPTGSGKTTTLYAMLSEINHGHDKIVTIEDPVEYQLAGVLQIPVNERKGLGFARGLRSILRHDPDKIMVGEIRDPETAQIAVQSALTGHLVFTTIHANNVFDVFGRFAQMGVDPYSFVSALNGILAQRLVRRVCSECAMAQPLSEIELREAGLDPAAWVDARPLAGRGCGRCRGTGFRGRTAIAELLLLDDELRQMIVEREPIGAIRRHARARGLRSLREEALALVRDGRSTLQEVNRVIGLA